MSPITDMAINGRGFFILQDDKGNDYYTRAGQFRLNAQYVLVDNVTGYKVMGLAAGNTLQPIDLSAVRLLKPTPTTEVDFTGNLVLVTLAIWTAAMAIASAIYVLVERPLQRLRGVVPERAPRDSAVTTTAARATTASV